MAPLDPLRLHVRPAAPAGWLHYQSSGLLLGSCFATEVGRRLLADGFTCQVNPYGNVFNPLSLFNCLSLTADQVEASAVCRDGIYTSLLLHSDVWGTTSEALLASFADQRRLLLAALQRADWLALTLGTAWVYTDRDTGLLCTNLHKQPAARFSRRLLSVDEILAAWQPFYDALPAKARQRIVVTVSPVIHGKDGLADNSLSKAVLTVAAHQMAGWPGVVYFPAQEIVRDELRDYRFYADDMQHPSTLAADIVYQRFLAYALAPAQADTLQAFRSLAAFARHRPRVVAAALYQSKLATLEALPIPEAAKAPLRAMLAVHLADG